MRKTSRTISALLALCMLMMVAVACGGNDAGNTASPSAAPAESASPAADLPSPISTNADTIDEPTAPASGKKYLIGMDTVFAPFEFTNDANEYVGIDVELLAAIAEDQGFEYEVQPLGFNAAVTALETGQVDGVIAGMSITDERKEKYDFSEPYYDSGVVMALKADNEDIKSYDDLKDKKVAVKTGTEGATFAESIKDQYGFEITYFDESPIMYEDVKTGNTVACFEDYPVMGYGISQGNGLKIVTDMEKGSSYGFAVLKGKNPELLEMFNKGLQNLKDSGKYQEILDTYIKES